MSPRLETAVPECGSCRAHCPHCRPVRLRCGRALRSSLHCRGGAFPRSAGARPHSSAVRRSCAHWLLLREVVPDEHAPNGEGEGHHEPQQGGRPSATPESPRPSVSLDPLAVLGEELKYRLRAALGRVVSRLDHLGREAPIRTYARRLPAGSSVRAAGRVAPVRADPLAEEFRGMPRLLQVPDPANGGCSLYGKPSRRRRALMLNERLGLKIWDEVNGPGATLNSRFPSTSSRAAEQNRAQLDSMSCDMDVTRRLIAQRSAAVEAPHPAQRSAPLD